MDKYVKIEHKKLFEVRFLIENLSLSISRSIWGIENKNDVTKDPNALLDIIFSVNSNLVYMQDWLDTALEDSETFEGEFEEDYKKFKLKKEVSNG